jgi:hypothetical protein
VMAALPAVALIFLLGTTWYQYEFLKFRMNLTTNLWY